MDNEALPVKARSLRKTLAVLVATILLMGLLLLSYTTLKQTTTWQMSAKMNPTRNLQHFPTDKMAKKKTENCFGKSIHVNKQERSGINLQNTTTPGASRPLELLKKAADAVKCSFVSASFAFSQDVHFQPPKSERAPKFPRLLFNPAFNVCVANPGSTKDPPFLMVLVMSSYLPNSVEERQAIRSTYGSVTRGKQWPGKRLGVPVRLVFLLGRPPTSAKEQQVREESREFGDLLVADFQDSYQNLTLKVLLGLHWVHDNCPQTKFILKTDDDTFVNLPLLTTFLRQRGDVNSIYGTAYLSSKVMREGRWKVAEKSYPFQTYPVYMSGTGYVLSADAGEELVKASRMMPVIPVEDAFITGILAQTTDIRRMYCSGFTNYNEGKPDLCSFMQDKRFVGNCMPAAEKKSMWASLRIDDRRSCS